MISEVAGSIPAIGSIATDRLFLAGVVTITGFFAARYWRGRSSLAHFLVQLLVFALLTGLLLAAGVLPYHPVVGQGAKASPLLVGVLELVWWLTGARLAVGFLRAFVVLGRRPRESQLAQDLIAALIYLAAAFAIVAYVFDLPLKGLLATSGVLAIVIGLALQSSLGDVFSGVVLNIERPYRVGDWIILDDAVQGKVIETNWRATHVLTASQDVAIVPNSVIAKSRLVNCSAPTTIHGGSIRVKLAPSLTPAAGRDLLWDVLLGSTPILRTPEPTVTVKDLSAEMIDFEVAFSVTDISALGQAQNQLFDRIHRAASAAGVTFSPRLAGAPEGIGLADKRALGTPERLVAGISLFATLTGDEKARLASQMRRKEYKAGDVVATVGTTMQALCIVSRGVLVAASEEDGRKTEIARLARGSYFGEAGLLAAEPLNGEITALTRVVIYEVSRDAISPLLEGRPRLVEELSESLASRRLARKVVLDGHHHQGPREGRLAERIAANVRGMFSVH